MRNCSIVCGLLLLCGLAARRLPAIQGGVIIIALLLLGAVLMFSIIRNKR